MSAPVEHQPAFILHRRPYRETSWILDLLTQDFGKVSLVAKGARQAKGTLSAVLQPFRPLWVSWAGKGSLKNLTRAEIQAHHEDPQTAWLYAAFYLNELLEVILPPGDPVPRLFQIYEATLADLRDQASLEPTLRYFEKRLLDELGFGLHYELDALSGAPVESDADYLWLPQHGFVRLRETKNGPVPDVELDELAHLAQSPQALRVPGQALLDIANHHFESPSTLRFAKRILRASIDDLLNGRPLHSRDLFRQFLHSQQT